MALDVGTSSPRPNLFLLGAPKCGTTALVTYLRSHPQAFVCTPKEPSYFTDDLPGVRLVSDEKSYLQLFARSGPRHRVRVDASVLHLYSGTAVAHIRAFAPKSRILVMLRDPVELFLSFQAQMLLVGIEDERRPHRAWSLQHARAAGRHIPPGCVEPALLQYAAVCRLGEQVERVLAHFPREQVRFVRLEDLRVRPRETYLGVLDFLGLDDDGRTHFPVVRPRRAPRSRRLRDLYLYPPPWLARPIRRAARGLGITRPDLRQWLHRLNTRRVYPAPAADTLDDSFAAELRATFHDDTARLARLTGGA